MNRRQKIIISIIGIFLVSFALIGLTYGYFLTRITPNSESESISLETEDLELTYYDGNGSLSPAEMLYPGNKVKFLTKSGEITDVKTFSVENTGLGKIDKYAVVLDEYSVYYTEDAYIDGTAVEANTKTYFQNPEHFKLNITCKVYDSDDLNTPKGDCEEQLDGTLPANNDILLYNSINENETHVYELSMEFMETNTDQSADMNKTLNARVNIMAVNDTVDLEVSSTDKTSGSYIEIEDAVNATSTSNESKEIKASFLNEIDSTGTLNNLSTSSTTRSYIDKDGTYKILGLMPGNYKIKYYNSNTDSLIDTKTVKIVKGKTASINDNVITITDSSRTFTMDIDSSNGSSVINIIKFYIKNPFSKNTLAYAILDNAVSLTEVEKELGYAELVETTLTKVAQEISVEEENVLSIAQDDYGTSYYYRGVVEDNYVDFNNMCWRIVRIEGDGSIKLVLEDQDSACATANGNWDIGTGHYGYNLTKVTNSSGQQSTANKYIADYINSPTNTETSMRAQFDTWYNTNLKSVEGKLKKDKWCLGNTTDPYNSTGTLLTSSPTDLMYSSTTFHYDTYRRLYGNGVTANATLRCDGNNYETYESYIGTLTADEVVFAGGKAGKSNSNYYLLNDYQVDEKKLWRTLSPARFGGSSVSTFFVGSGGDVSNYFVLYGDSISLRPAVSLVSGTQFAEGNGSINSPYKIK